MGQGIQKNDQVKWQPLKNLTSICLKAVFKKFDFNLFKGCLPQILLGAFLNTLTHIWLHVKVTCNSKFEMFEGLHNCFIKETAE